MGTIEARLKSELGTILQLHIDSIDTNGESGSSILQVISMNDNACYADLRHKVVQLIKHLGTIYAYLLPSELAILLNRVQHINGGEFILSNIHDRTIMIGLGQGYDEVSLDYMQRTSTISAL